MSMTLANIKLAVYSRLNPEGGTPAYTALNEGNITRWAQEKCSEVIRTLDPSQYQALVITSSALTFSTSGSDARATLPTSPAIIKAVSLKVGSTSKRCVIYENPEDYARWDSGNFVYTPTSSKPVAKIANGYVYVRPNTITTGVLEYVKVHPTLGASQDTVFTPIGDNLLIELVVAEVMKSLQLLG
jgi:hypothetical protein